LSRTLENVPTPCTIVQRGSIAIYAQTSTIARLGFTAQIVPAMAKAPEWQFGGGDPLGRVVAIIRAKGRLQLPPGSREILGATALGLMAHPGRLQLFPWEPQGAEREKAFEEARAELARGADTIEDPSERCQRSNLLPRSSARARGSP
jgi:hypothetical protein